MRNFLQKCQREIVFSAILYAILGILLLVFNVKALGTIIQVLGWIFIVYAIYNFYLYFVRRDSLSSGPLVIAIPFLLIGIVLARNPGFVISMSSILIGIVVLFNGIVHIQTSLFQKDLGYTNWGLSLVYSILITIVGGILIVNPIDTVSTVLKIGGILLIIQACSVLVSQHRIHKLSKEYDKENNIVDGDFKDIK
ncbi:HdeD family acid-resistance protein [Absicoccus intestinalis]|uniref:DUF308 domain-containing protein n=1 Tax=Absicoccus intestinalis TaxID=2926319 RepID=A0ABU4WIB4_9FIRM|nr:DUF308 domain-containing protein [Absicoccus sp. CLA-KB-P134]MDX8416295.1 DUF308 domain-containing protein [Absicoccus sp. CLA-KB-P134]